MGALLGMWKNSESYGVKGTILLGPERVRSQISWRSSQGRVGKRVKIWGGIVV